LLTFTGTDLPASVIVSVPLPRCLLERVREACKRNRAHALATVVPQRPRFCRDSVPRTRRPTSSFQSDSSSTAMSARSR